MTASEIIKERIALLEARITNSFDEVERTADQVTVIELKMIINKLEHTDEPVG
jgi:hypothetical protein